MKKEVIVAIDYSSTSTGIVITDALSGDYICAYLIAPKIKDFDKRINIIGRTLFELLEDLNIKVITIESPSYHSVGRTSSLSQGYGFLKYTILEKGYRLMEFPPTTIKKFATGNGRASKEDMIKATAKELIEEFEAINPRKIDDLVDALAIAKLAYSKLKEEKL